MQTTPISADAKSHVYEDAICATCNHKLSSHGDLLNVKLDELDRKIRFVLRLEQLNQDFANTQDSRQRELSTSTLCVCVCVCDDHCPPLTLSSSLAFYSSQSTTQ